MTKMVAALVMCALFSAALASDPSATTASYSDNWKKIMEGFKGLWSDVQKSFLNTYKKADDFNANTKEELQKKMNDTKAYLMTVNAYKNELVAAGKNTTKQHFDETTQKVDSWIKDVDDFQKRAQNATGTELENLKNDWNRKMTDTWNNGLNDVIEVSQNAKITDKPQNNAIHLSSNVFILLVGFLLSFPFLKY